MFVSFAVGFQLLVLFPKFTVRLFVAEGLNFKTLVASQARCHCLSVGKHAKLAIKFRFSKAQAIVVDFLVTHPEAWPSGLRSDSSARRRAKRCQESLNSVSRVKSHRP